MASDKENFMAVLMSRLCEKFKYVRTNRGHDTVEFTIDDIFKSRNEAKPEDAGFYISKDTGWDRPYVESTLLPYVEGKGLIEKLADGDSYRLTENGKNYCNKIDASIA